jgi:hypothetical protein
MNKITISAGLRWMGGAVALFSVSLAFGLVAGCASLHAPASSQSAPADPASILKDKWGIEITSLRMSGNGHLIDFRYRVFDPVKAAMLGDRQYTPCMIDQATGTRLVVPNTPKLGPLRQSATRLEAGKIYFMLFANSGHLVKAGSKVTVIIGDFRAENLTVG